MPTSRETALLGLLEGPAHTASIARRVARSTSDAIIPHHGNLHQALKRLEIRGLVTSEWATDRRRVLRYTLTAAGETKAEDLRQALVALCEPSPANCHLRDAPP